MPINRESQIKGTKNLKLRTKNLLVPENQSLFFKSTARSIELFVLLIQLKALPIEKYVRSV